MGLFWWIFPGSKTLVSFFFSKKKKLKDYTLHFHQKINQSRTNIHELPGKWVDPCRAAWGKWQCAAAEENAAFLRSLPATCVCTRVLTAAHTRTCFSLTVAPSSFPKTPEILAKWGRAENRITSVTVFIYITPAGSHGTVRPKILWARARQDASLMCTCANHCSLSPVPR